MVYDLDGDGKAEVAMKTADGSTDGKGHVIGDAKADWRNLKNARAAMAVFSMDLNILPFLVAKQARPWPRPITCHRVIPLMVGGALVAMAITTVMATVSTAYLACVAYLDGELPSVVMCRGYYGRSVLAAWDFRDGKLTSRWVFDSLSLV